VNAEEPVVVESNCETLGALGIFTVEGPGQSCIDVREISSQGVVPSRFNWYGVACGPAIDSIEEVAEVGTRSLTRTTCTPGRSLPRSVPVPTRWCNSAPVGAAF
jgi:hypothetical protein